MLIITSNVKENKEIYMTVQSRVQEKYHFGKSKYFKDFVNNILFPSYLPQYNFTKKNSPADNG